MEPPAPLTLLLDTCPRGHKLAQRDSCFHLRAETQRPLHFSKHLHTSFFPVHTSPRVLPLSLLTVSPHWKVSSMRTWCFPSVPAAPQHLEPCQPWLVVGLCSPTNGVLCDSHSAGEASEAPLSISSAGCIGLRLVPGS